MVKDQISSQKVDPKILERARELRRSMTPAEIIDRFIVDFYCHQAGLVIEVDGPIHAKQKEEDALRTEQLENLMLTVLRFTNRDVMNDLGSVVDNITTALESKCPFLKPSGAGGVDVQK